MNKTTGIIATIAATLLCGCPGAFLCLAGGLIALGVPVTTVINDQTSVREIPSYIGYGALIAALLLIAVPVVVGFLTLRRRRDRLIPPPATVRMPAAAPSPQAPQPSASETAAPQPVAAKVASQPSGIEPSTKRVYDSLMALNRTSAPFHIVDGRAEGVDLIAEWKIVDAQWYEIFAKAKLTKTFRIFMKLDPAKRQVRAMDQEYTLSWSAGVPQLSVEKSFFKGQKSSVSFGTGYAFTENFAPGQVYKYRFNTNELKKPIQTAIGSCGWKYKGVALGKL